MIVIHSFIITDDYSPNSHKTKGPHALSVTPVHIKPLHKPVRNAYKAYASPTPNFRNIIISIFLYIFFLFNTSTVLKVKF